MLTQRHGSLLLLLLAANSACKAARWRESARPEGVDAAAVASGWPQRLEVTAISSPPPPVMFEVDERTGKSKVDLVLRLDYFPEPRPGATNLPVCHRSLPADFEIGTVACTTTPETRTVVLAKHVTQDCYTEANDRRISPEVPIVLPGCKRGQIQVHAFDPALRVDVEVRDP